MKLPWYALLGCLWTAVMGLSEPEVALRGSDKLVLMHILCYALFVL